MIAVIADDFTGAAELGGIGLRYHLSVEISTVVNPATKADLLVIAADTRSGSEADAVAQMENITRALLPLKPSLVFKKTDSVLRGHIVPEIHAQLKVLQLSRSLLVAANPALGRTIHNGVYFLHGQPVHLSAFSADPEFAITSSGLYDMLRATPGTVQIKKATESLPGIGIIAGEVQTAGDTKAWAEHVNENTLPAGGAGFFTAILDKLNIKKTGRESVNRAAETGLPLLFVSGTTFHKNRDAIKKILEAGGPVSYMPPEIGTAEKEDDIRYSAWCNEVVSLIRVHKKAIIAIHPDTGSKTLVSSSVLRHRMAMAVQMILERVEIATLFIEGGSTAYAVLQRAGFTGFLPVAEMAPGVIKMKVIGNEGLHIIVKPGSYDWPANINIAI